MTAPNSSPSRDVLLASLRDVAGRLDTDYVSRSTWERESGINQYHVYKLFESWNEFVDAEGVVNRGRLSRFCRSC